MLVKPEVISVCLLTRIVVRDRGAVGGVQLSASHNPARYNGLKLFSAAGRVLAAAAGREVLAAYEALPAGMPPLPDAEPGTRLEHDGTPAHVRLVAATVDVEAIRRRRVWKSSPSSAAITRGNSETK